MVRLPADLPCVGGLSRTFLTQWYVCTGLWYSRTTMFLAWSYLAAAIASEVGSTVLLRDTEGFTRPLPTILSIAGYAFSMWLMALTLDKLDVSLVYAVWAGVGTVAIAVIGMATLGETVNALKIASIGIIIAGVIGLNLSGAS